MSFHFDLINNINFYIDLINYFWSTGIFASLVRVWASRDTTLSRTIFRAVFCDSWINVIILNNFYGMIWYWIVQLLMQLMGELDQIETLIELMPHENVTLGRADSHVPVQHIVWNELLPGPKWGHVASITW